MILFCNALKPFAVHIVLGFHHQLGTQLPGFVQTVVGEPGVHFILHPLMIHQGLGFHAVHTNCCVINAKLTLLETNEYPTIQEIATNHHRNHIVATKEDGHFLLFSVIIYIE